MTAVYKFLPKLLGELVHLTMRWVTAVNIILHVFKKTLIHLIDDSNALHCNIAVNGGDAAMKNAIPHKEGIMVNPIPQVEATCFEWFEGRLNALDIGITVLLSDGIQFRLQCSNIALLDICSMVTSASI